MTYNSDPKMNELVTAAVRHMAGEGCTCEPDIELRADPDGVPGIHLVHEPECVLVLEWSMERS